LKGGAEHHELIDQVSHLQALIIIFGGLPTAAREFVLEAITVVFLDIEALVFNLESPPKTLFLATDLLRGCKAEHGSQQARRRRIPVVLEGECQRCLDFFPGKTENLSGGIAIAIAIYGCNSPIKGFGIY
jgi:hypothetical protein